MLRERSGFSVTMPKSGKYRSLKVGARKAVPATARTDQPGATSMPQPSLPVVWLPYTELWSQRRSACSFCASKRPV